MVWPGAAAPLSSPLFALATGQTAGCVATGCPGYWDSHTATASRVALAAAMPLRAAQDAGPATQPRPREVRCPPTSSRNLQACAVIQVGMAVGAAATDKVRRHVMS